MNDFVKDYVADAQVVLKSFPIVAFSIKKYQFLPKVRLVCENKPEKLCSKKILA